MKVYKWSWCVSLLLASVSAAQTKPGTSGAAVPVTVKAPAVESRPESTEKSGKLPVRRVVLYKNGVGYFEHLGRVRGNQDVQIDFTSAQLNDVLKSLTVLDLSGGRITGVGYNSDAPLARRLASLRLALGEKPTVAEFLSALRGARLEVRNGAAPAVTGRLLSVERKTRSATNWTVETDEISLIGESGEVRTVDLNPTTSIRVVEHDLQTEVGRYLGLMASARDLDARRMTISTAGSGERNLYVSYISEVPVWKTTYRIVLPSKADRKPLLQGWAIVDNTVGEDWNDVELSLVAGAPHSFIQQISEPFYSRRPVVALPESYQRTPQTHGATLIGGKGRLTGVVTDQTGAAMGGASVRLLDENNNLVAQTTSDGNGNYTFLGLAEGNYRAWIERPGFQKTVVNGVVVGPGESQLNSSLQVGSASTVVEVTANSPGVENSMSNLALVAPGVANRPHVGRESMGMASKADRFTSNDTNGGAFAASPEYVNLYEARIAAEAAASGQELGDLFEYKLKDRVTLKKNQSALVPIAQTEIEAEKVSLWSGTNGSGRPLRGLWMRNTSPLTFDGGSFSVLEGEVFAGEGLLDPVKPGERRLLSYAADLGMLVQAVQNGQPQKVTRVKIAKGVLTQVSEVHERTMYTIRNQDAAPRTVVIEHPARPDWKLAASVQKPDEQAPGLYRFRVDAPAHAATTLSILEVRTASATFQISDLDAGKVALFVKQQTITPEIEQELRKVLAQKAVVAKLEEEMELRQKDIDRIVADQQRLRENLKALKGSVEEKQLVLRYTRQLDEQETQLDILRKKIQETEERRDKANEELENMVDALQLEATL